MMKEVINELKKYTVGKKNTEKTEISVLNLNRLIFALEEQESKTGHWMTLEEWKKDFKGFINELSMPKDDYNGIMEYIDEVPNEVTWIPVSERLPEWDIECLVVDDKDEFGVGFYRDDVGAWDSPSWGWLERKDDVDNYDAYYMPCGIGKVVAWMPLPSPYQPQERSDKE